MLVVWLASITFIYKKALSRLKCRSSPPVKISKSPAFSSSVSLLVSFCFLFARTASFILNYRSSLPVQISKKPGYSSSESFLVSFCCFYSVKVLFPLNCGSSLSVHLSRKPGYWNCNRLQVRFCYFYSQRASFTINCSSSLPFQILYRRSRHSRAVLTFWWVSVFLILKKSIVSTKLSLILTSSDIRCRNTQASDNLLVSFCYFVS